MKLNVATTWDNAYLDYLHELDQRDHTIGSVFGSGAMSLLGSARPERGLPHVSLPEQKEHITRARSYGFEFAYTVNAPCLGNVEFTPRGQKQIRQFFETLCELGVDWVVLSVPYLIEIVNRNFPQLKVKLSVVNHVNAMHQLRHYADLGVDAVTLDWNLNRDFRFLKKAVAFGRVELELLATDQCLYGCPFRLYHYNILGHTSQSQLEARAFYVDYPSWRCTLLKYSQPAELIRSPWIRPDDLGVYEAIGIQRFKIGFRTANTARNMIVARAYAERHYEGNLFELIYGPGMPYAIDNRALDGFLKFFEKQTCYLNCDTCTHCTTVAQEKVRLLQPEVLAEERNRYEQISDRLLTCTLYDHEPEGARP
jgi:collagenase-like PrtC family protease